MNEKVDLAWELEYAEANLSDDIQALAYIQDDLETTKKNAEMILKIPEISNRIQMLFKSLIYNRDNLQRALDKYYENKKEKKEEENKKTLYVDEKGVKHIRMGWEHQYIKGIILSDDTIIQNMQCSLDAKIPTDEELIEIDEKNFKPKPKEEKKDE